MAIQHEFPHGKITELVVEEIAHCTARIEKLFHLQGPQVFEEYDAIIADLIDRTEGARFMFFVHTDADIRHEAEQAQETIDKYLVDLGARRDIYDFLKCNAGSASAVQQRLIDKTLQSFRRSGLDLPDLQLREVTEGFKRLAQIDTQFHAALNADATQITLSEEDVAGVPESLLSRLRQQDHYVLRARVSDVVPFLQHAHSATARKRAVTAYDNRATGNAALLAEAVAVRQKLAPLLGFSTWADYRTETKMAKTADLVLEFLYGLKTALLARRDADIAMLLAFKRTQEQENVLNPWDVVYCENQLLKKEYDIDAELIREYFPAEHVMETMLDIFSTILGVTFVKTNVCTWHASTVHYEIRRNGTPVAQFYADMYPREGKYTHAAAFTLRRGRNVHNGYLSPISAIVSNFTPAAEGKPALLSHDEVVTLFHEFGHIMHQTLTTAPYAALSGTNVANDFVETLSQLFENWAWDKELLRKLSRHYATNAPLPDDMLDRIISTRNFNGGWFSMRQVFLSLYDMELHTSPGVHDPIETYKQMYRETLSLDPLPETHFPAGFGHLVGGYDAGYYGYLWSKVYAQDMFSRFSAEGLLNHKTGEDLLAVLQAGDMLDGIELIQRFLGRKPSNAAFIALLSQ